ncbi:MAG: hypothetical protein ABI847_20605, partial [Anaerolineales bacterium]
SVVGSLCEAYQDSTRHDAAGHWVNLLFDRDTPVLTVKSPYTHDCLEINLKQPGPLFVRVPPWVEPNDLSIEGAPAPTRWNSHYLFFENAPIGLPIRLRFPLKESTLTLTSRHHPQPIRVRLAGDGPVAMDNFGMDLTYFETYEAGAA